jgi:membrane-bound lytic murein transglycosylase B
MHTSRNHKDFSVLMRWPRLAVRCFLVVIAGLLTTATLAQDPAGFEAWVEALAVEALEKGISQKTVDEALTGLEAPIPKVVELDRNQPEFTLTLEGYLSRVATQSRVTMAKQKLAEHRELFDQVAERFGVQPRFVAAFWAVESDFGRVQGGFPVIQALATLAFDNRRGSFFRKQLFAALEIIDEGSVTLAEFKGSWAGALGQPQFLPSVFLLGWLGDQTWGREVTLPDNFDKGLAGLGTSKPIGDWQALGVRRIDGSDLPTRQLLSSIVLPEDGDNSRAFLVYNNYRSILRWNRSDFFAIAVGSLADRIGDG